MVVEGRSRKVCSITTSVRSLTSPARPLCSNSIRTFSTARTRTSCLRAVSTHTTRLRRLAWLTPTAEWPSSYSKVTDWVACRAMRTTNTQARPGSNSTTSISNTARSSRTATITCLKCSPLTPQSSLTKIPCLAPFKTQPWPTHRGRITPRRRVQRASKTIWWLMRERSWCRCWRTRVITNKVPQWPPRLIWKIYTRGCSKNSSARPSRTRSNLPRVSSVWPPQATAIPARSCSRPPTSSIVLLRTLRASASLSKVSLPRWLITTQSNRPAFTRVTWVHFRRTRRPWCWWQQESTACRRWPRRYSWARPKSTRSSRQASITTPPRGPVAPATPPKSRTPSTTMANRWSTWTMPNSRRSSTANNRNSPGMSHTTPRKTSRPFTRPLTLTFHLTLDLSPLATGATILTCKGQWPISWQGLPPKQWWCRHLESTSSSINSRMCSCRRLQLRRGRRCTRHIREASAMAIPYSRV